MVVVLSAHLRTGHSLFHEHASVLATEAAAAGPRLLNSLATNLRQMTSYGQFRRHLKSHLFSFLEITHCAYDLVRHRNILRSTYLLIVQTVEVFCAVCGEFRLCRNMSVQSYFASDALHVEERKVQVRGKCCCRLLEIQ